MTDVLSKNPKTEGMQSKHNRKIVFSGVALTLGSMEYDLKIMSTLMDEIEPIMLSSGYLGQAAFLWIGMVFLYGLKNEDAPRYRRIDKKDGELEIKIELDMRVLLTADELDPALLKEFFEIATLDCLIHAGKKYKLPTQVFEDMRSKLGNIPEWNVAMDEFPEMVSDNYQRSKPKQ